LPFAHRFDAGEVVALAIAASLTVAALPTAN